MHQWIKTAPMEARMDVEPKAMIRALARLTLPISLPLNRSTITVFVAPGREEG